MPKEKLQMLIDKLKIRDNKAYEFFERIALDLTSERSKNEGLIKLKGCFAITQYADFTFEEEELLSEIIDEINSNE